MGGLKRFAMVFCCFSDKPLTKEECHDNRMKDDGAGHPYCRTEGRSFQTSMCKAPCEEPCCCCLTFITLTYGTSWCARRKVISDWNHEGTEVVADWNKYSCCQGFAPCCQECCDGLVCCEGDGRCICACCECCCCPGLAISGTRLHLMVEFDLIPDPGDLQIIRFSNCMQCLACLCRVLAHFVEACRTVSQIIDCIAHIVFLCTASCMVGQIWLEKNHQLELEKAENMFGGKHIPWQQQLSAPGGYPGQAYGNAAPPPP